MEDFVVNDGILREYIGKNKTAAIPEGVVLIGWEAFKKAGKLKKLSISKTVEYIGPYTFSYCTALENISVDEDNPKYCSEDGILYKKNKRILIACPPNKSGEIVIPKGVTKIETCAFYNCDKITKVVLPSGLVKIDIAAFGDCKSLEEINIRKGTKEIKLTAFKDCSSLKNIVLPEGVEKINVAAFCDCTNLESIIIPKTVNEIGAMAFEGCTKLTVFAPKGSYAEDYAKQNNIPYKEI